MRVCSRCTAPDRIHLTTDECDCGADAASLIQNSHIAGDSEHAPDCMRIGHFVMLDWPFPRIYRDRELQKADPNDRHQTHGLLLPVKFRTKWRLVERSNGTFMRVRTLCRTCITEELAIADRVKEYEAAKAKMSGKKITSSWASALAAQDSL